MKYMKFLMAFFLSLSTITHATEVKPKTVTISQLIEKIKHAPSQNKHILMNQLKVKLREMNQETRKKTMKELQKSFASKKGTQSTLQSSKISGSISSAGGIQQGKMQQASPAQYTPQRQITPAPIRQGTPMRTHPGTGQQRGRR